MPYKTDSYFSINKRKYETWRLRFLDSVLTAISDFRPDIIISHHLFLLTSIIRQVWRGPLVGVCHGTDLRNLSKSQVFKDMTVNIKDLDLVFSLSNTQKKEISKIFDMDESKIEVLGGGYREDIFHKAEKSKDKIKVVYAGKFSSAKGVYELIAAFKKIENAKLIMVGAKDNEEYFKFRFLTRKLDAEVHKQLAQEKLAEIFTSSHIFVLPSYYEGLGLVCLEALASGMKVVTTKIKGLEELLGEEVLNSYEFEEVSLPRLKNLDEPYKEDIDSFVKRLRDKINLSIDRVVNGQYTDVSKIIEKHSWYNIASKIDKELVLLVKENSTNI